MTKAQDNFRQRMIDGAIRYARADRSDLFTLARCLSEIDNGVAGIRSEDCTMWGRGKGPAVGEAFANADIAKETRKLPDGETYQVMVYRNMVRP